MEYFVFLELVARFSVFLHAICADDRAEVVERILIVCNPPTALVVAPTSLILTLPRNPKLSHSRVSVVLFLITVPPLLGQLSRLFLQLTHVFLLRMKTFFLNVSNFTCKTFPSIS